MFLMALAPTFSQKEIKVKNLSKKEGITKLVIYSSRQTMFQQESIIEGRKTTHFSPLKVMVDSIFDTINLNCEYHLYYEEPIIKGYLQMGIPYLITSEDKEKKRKYLGFWTIESVLSDTIKFAYFPVTKKLNISEWTTPLSKEHLNYGLFVSWIILIVVSVVSKILDRKRISILSEKRWEFFKESTPVWAKVLFFVAVILFIIAMIITILSQSTIVLLAIIITSSTYSWIKKKKEKVATTS